MSETPKTWGGSRPGSGRPSKNRPLTLCVKVSAETMAKLKRTGKSLGDTIEELAKSL